MRILISVASLLLLVLTGEAAESDKVAPDPGWNYEVVRVKPGDRLNVRKSAEPGSPILSELQADMKNVTVTGRRSRADNGSQKHYWWEVVSPDGRTGWVNSEFLSLPQRQISEREQIDYPLNCVGTEPLWELQINRPQALFTPLIGEAATDGLVAGTWNMAVGLRGHFAIRFEKAGALTGFLTVLDRLAVGSSCSDNMSDVDYPFHATYVGADGKVLGGCCSRLR